MGLAYGATLPSNSYKEATGRRGTEHYLELYYKYVVHGDGETKGLHVTPDQQLITHPAGDETADRNDKPKQQKQKQKKNTRQKHRHNDKQPHEAKNPPST